MEIQIACDPGTESWDETRLPDLDYGDESEDDD